MLHTKIKLSSSYQPQATGQIEVVNKNLGDFLLCLVGDRVSNWDQVLPIAKFTYSSSVN